MTPAQVLTRLNEIGGANGVGRLDIVENRYVGMKSRGIYETPGGTILLAAHQDLETLTIDREAQHVRDSLIPKYAQLVYNGFWFAPEREAIQALVSETQKTVNGEVRLKLYKGNVSVVGRKSPDSLYSERHVTFEDDAGAYDQKDAEGFIRSKADIESLLADKNIDPNNIDTQIDFIYHELHTKPELGGSQLKNAKTISDATNVFTAKYLELPNDISIESRKSFAYDAHERFSQS